MCLWSKRLSPCGWLAVCMVLALSLSGCAKNNAGNDGMDSEAALEAARREAALRQDKGTGTMGEGETIAKLVPIYFDFDQASVRPSERDKVRAVAEHIKGEGQAAFRLRLEGHADDRGSADYNLVLGQRRADAVRDLLVAYGVAQDRIETVSYGEEFPVVKGTDSESYALNRRVEFVLLTQ